MSLVCFFVKVTFLNVMKRSDSRFLRTISTERRDRRAITRTNSRSGNKLNLLRVWVNILHLFFNDTLILVGIYIHFFLDNNSFYSQNVLTSLGFFRNFVFGVIVRT